MKKVLIINGSSRKNGNTQKIIELIKEDLNADIIHLVDKDIHHYDYEHSWAADDFLPLMKSIVENYEVVIFATPIYWYTMSALMKVFFDRISDCLQTEKELGRQLRGKSMAAICCGSEEREVEGFFIPFRMSADYLGMEYLGDIHTWVGEETPTQDVETRVIAFAQKIKTQL